MMQRSPKVGCFARSPWAIKKWVKGRSSDVNNSHLRLEADILRQLNHPNIVGFRAFTTGPDGKPCLAMEAVDMSLGTNYECLIINIYAIYICININSVLN
jgi:PDZ-binding kinase